MTIEYLCSTYKKTKEETIQYIDSLNISGTILVANQLCPHDSYYEIKRNCYHAKVFNLQSKGVSLSRNFLIEHSSADFVTFLDDDMYMKKGFQKVIEETAEKYSKYNAIRFNVISDNDVRPIRQLNKLGVVGFKSLSSFGVWGIFFNRRYLIDHGIKFNEQIGPGTEFNHGEDAVFNKLFLKYSKIFSVPLIGFHAKQTDSTWHENRDLRKELIAHGYNYYLLFGAKAIFMAFLFLVTHMNCYPKGTKFGTLFRYMKEGIKKSREASK